MQVGMFSQRSEKEFLIGIIHRCFLVGKDVEVLSGNGSIRIVVCIFYIGIVIDLANKKLL